MSLPSDEPAFQPPPIIVGAWQLSAGHHKRGLSAEDAIDVFLALIARGITTFDCADIYTGVEDLLGRVRRTAHARLGRQAADSLRVHTKFVPDRSALAHVDRTHVQCIIDRSLRRLGVERLDLVQFAWWDYAVPGYVEVALYLDDLRREGKIAHVGATNFDVPHLTEILDAGVPVVAHQVQYSVLDRRPEHGMTALAKELGFRLLCYGGLAGGFLTDRWLGQADPAPGGLVDARNLPNRSLTKYRLLINELGGWEAYQHILGVLAAVADAHGVSTVQVALRWLLDRPSNPSVILGVSSPERMEQALGAIELQLTTADRGAIDAALAGLPGLKGPCFGFERDPNSPHAAVMKYDLNRT